MTSKLQPTSLMPICSSMLARLSKTERRRNRELARQSVRLVAAIRNYDRSIVKEKNREQVV